MTSQAIAIGINQYEFLQPLSYAQQDALALKTFLETEAGFDRVFYFSDNSPNFNSKSTKPSRNNLRKILREIFAEPFMRDGDNFWFFFSGHGMRHEERDYLMPIDGDPNDVAESGIPTNLITEYLRRCGADNVVMILDACRSSGRKDGKGIGNQTEQISKQTGVISIFSCSPNQYSYEMPNYQQGAFTKALLEGLGMQQACATVERLNHYLQRRVPEIVQTHYSHAAQTPYTIAEPITKSHLILVPRYARPIDAEPLRNDALRAEVQGNYKLAKQCWIRVLAVCPADLEAIDSIERLATRSRRGEAFGQNPLTEAENIVPNASPLPPQNPPPLPTKSGRAGLGNQPVNADSVLLNPPLRITEPFDIITVDATGKETSRKPGQATYFTEDLGNGIRLEMVQIPAGSFLMGAAKGEVGASRDEYPQHQVTLPSFFMGRFAVTQAQWQAVAKLPKVNIDLQPDPSRFKGADLPVEQVSWDEAVEFCARLSRHANKPYRLPSEAEWEYACRAGTTTPFHFGATLTTALANCYGNYPYGNTPKEEYRSKTVPVGNFPPNAFGLYDMHGNVWEWCLDPWHDTYDRAPSDGSAWEKNGDDSRLLRGGSWSYNPVSCRSANRLRDARDNRNGYVGFRVVCVVPRTL